MSMSIDRGLISERLYGFAGKSDCNLIVGPPNYVSNANDGCLTQDIAEANRLLDENGVVDSDGDGIRKHDGHPLKVVFQTSTNDVRQETQRLIRDWWADIGIEVEIVHHDANLFFGGDPSRMPRRPIAVSSLMFRCTPMALASILKATSGNHYASTSRLARTIGRWAT